jgi:hypothetical protein
MVSEDITDLFKQSLRRLTLRPTRRRRGGLEELEIDLSARLQRAPRLGEPPEPPEFTIGDNVTIQNPGLSQENNGTITKITRRRITVTTFPSGQKIIRAPKNLLLSQ